MYHAVRIERSEMLLEQYRMSLNQDKKNIEVRNDGAIKRKQISFYFMQQIIFGYALLRHHFEPECPIFTG